MRPRAVSSAPDGTKRELSSSMNSIENNQMSGEGDHEAGRRYQRASSAYAASGDVSRAAREAADAVDGPEAEALETARRVTAGGTAGPTVFELLRESHDKQRTLLRLVGKTHGDSRGRRELFERLATELREHAAREEHVLYSKMLGVDMSRDKARHSVHEHEEIEELTARLEQMSNASSGWLSVFQTLSDKVLHHLEEEEHGAFQLAGRALDDTQKAALARELERVREAGAMT